MHQVSKYRSAPPHPLKKRKKIFLRILKSLLKLFLGERVFLQILFGSHASTAWIDSDLA